MPQRRRPADEAEAKALASPLRLRILRICLDPHTNREIANVLGRDPASVLHHVRTLVDTGFLHALDARRGTRGAREIPYEATGKSWWLSTPGSSTYLLDTFVEEVGLVPAESIDATRIGVRLGDADRAEFERRLLDLLEEFKRRGDADGRGAALSIFLAVHPDPNRP